MYKQVIAVRADIKISRGKLAVQAAHASVSAIGKVDKRVLKAWEKEGQKKIVVKAKDLDELIALKERCEKLKIPCSLISDAGLTELPSGTITALGIGPCEEERADKVTGSLPLLS